MAKSTELPFLFDMVLYTWLQFIYILFSSRMFIGTFNQHNGVVMTLTGMG